jgi:K+-sensing histidine kinase KdpD
MRAIGKSIERFVQLAWPFGLIAWLLVLITWSKLELTFLGRDTPFLMYFFVVGVAALVSGLRAGLITTLAAAVMSYYYFLQPAFTFDLSLSNFLKISLFCLEGVMITLIVERERRSRRKMKQSLDELEVTRQRLAEANERATNLLADVMDKSVDRPMRKHRQ